MSFKKNKKGFVWTFPIIMGLALGIPVLWGGVKVANDPLSMVPWYGWVLLIFIVVWFFKK